MKKTVINISLIIVAMLIYILQANFFHWFSIAGIMPNLFRTMGTIYGLIVGIILDLTIGTKVGSYSIGLGLIGFLAAIFDKNFSKDSRMTIMVMVVVVTCIFEILSYLLMYIFFSIHLEIVNFIKILAVEVVYNLILTIIIYPLIQKCGYFIENEYKDNRILTRYF